MFPEHNIQIEEKARILYKEYCKQEEGKPREITMHTVKKIFPRIMAEIIHKTFGEKSGFRMIDHNTRIMSY